MMNKFLIIIVINLGMVAVVLAGEISGELKCRGVRDCSDVVVYIDKINEDVEVPKEHVVMNQKNLKFLPHVIPIVVGTTVDYLNSDDVLHNVFSPDKCAEKFNLGTWSKGKTRSYTYNDIDCGAVMLCNVHPEMEAWILVLQNKYFYKTDKDGKYAIKDVPPGKYELKVWHEKIKGKPQEVEITSDETVTVNFKLKR
ncbi:MAG: carboxypeptidase regulatory-like domain-containing protein [Candidatus Marinimicrobia bacterium]|nr:carboxypeptidase regulatory-like domain-containing protein [Candidatus Neomarinimicrobiota bacterium]